MIAVVATYVILVVMNWGSSGDDVNNSADKLKSRNKSSDKVSIQYDLVSISNAGNISFKIF